MLVRVKKEHIARGLQADYRACPIAWALAECTSRTDSKSRPNGSVYVDLQHMYVGPFRYPVSEALRQWLQAFDDGRKVKPIHIHLGEGEFSLMESDSLGLLKQRVYKAKEPA